MKSNITPAPHGGSRAKKTSGVWATAKFNFTPDPKVMQQYLDLLNQGKTHEEAIAIIESKSLPE